jgi:hydroxymethylpyrimidine pyrophosphatase-like HAD family hydrolase
MNKTQAKKLLKYQEEIDIAKKTITDDGFTIYGDIYIRYEKTWSKDSIEIMFSFKDNLDRRFHAVRYKTGWALQLAKSCKYVNDAYNPDVFVFTDKVYYAFPGGSPGLGGGSDCFKKATFEVCFETFMNNYEEAYKKVQTELVSVKWIKGIGNHDYTYPSGEGTFYINTLDKNRR